MLRHKGKSRTYVHNLQLASMLSFVAGIVNISGVLSVKILTTNVTGHFAFFSEEVSIGQYRIALLYLIFILSFLIGAFVSSLLVEFVLRKHISFSYALPMLLETTTLGFIAYFGGDSGFGYFQGQLIACALLFAMGLQNSLVTKVSQSVIRTTHLTGLFTDLGIELSQLLFKNYQSRIQQLRKSIYLKMAIIGCFFAGCLIGGVVYKSLQMHTLYIAVVCLVFATFYDNIRIRYYYIKRRIHFRR